MLIKKKAVMILISLLSLIYSCSQLGDNLINALGAIDVLEAVLSLETSSIKILDFGVRVDVTDWRHLTNHCS